MTHRLLTLILCCSGFLGYAQVQDSFSNVHIGLIYPLSSNGKHAPQYTNKVSVHLLAGVSGAEQSFCLSGFANVIKHTANGFTGAGFINVTGQRANGVQVAGFCNITGQKSSGCQAAGFINITDTMLGVQAAGFCNIANTASGSLQVGGFVNKARSVHTQIGGFINKAQQVSGIQVAGFINIAEKINGVQVSGFINIADSCDYPIGLLNLIRNGEKTIGLSVDETGTLVATFRSGTKKIYGILGAGGNMGQQHLFYALEAGIGSHFNINRFFRITTEAVALSMTDFDKNDHFRSVFRCFPSMRAGRNLEIYAGPSFSFTSFRDKQNNRLEQRYVWQEHSNDYFRGLSIGFIAGLQMHL